MKFKVGDKVRLTRESIVNSGAPTAIMKELVLGTKIERIENEEICIEGNCRWKESELELVPEEPEFEYGEAIEVKIGEGFPWVERPFIYFSKGNAIHPYITANINKAQFDAGKKFDFQAFRYARKLKPQLTRKEIAEKFGVSEDFTLVD